MEFFRKFFGFPNHQPDSYGFQRPETSPPSFSDDLERPEDMNENDQSGSFHNRNHGMNFNVFTDPLEMHRYFEHQMDSLFKSFGMPSFGNMFPAIQQPDLDEQHEEKEYPHNSREYFLKKGYEKPAYEHPFSSEKLDKDLDGKLSITDLDSLFRSSKDNEDKVLTESRSLQPHHGLRPFGGNFFKKSVQIRTIRSPDGSFETHKTVTDSEGNEETTITKTLGDKEYRVVKKRDKEGKEETHETLINATEDEKSLFTKTANPPGPFFDETMFSKFFK